MPPKKVIAEEKFSEILEEALQPIKDSLKKLITHENVVNLLNVLEETLLKKMKEQAEELKDLKRKTDHLEGRVAILENLVQTLERKTDGVEHVNMGGDFVFELIIFLLVKGNILKLLNKNCRKNLPYGSRITGGCNRWSSPNW